MHWIRPHYIHTHTYTADVANWFLHFTNETLFSNFIYSIKGGSGVVINMVLLNLILSFLLSSIRKIMSGQLNFLCFCTFCVHVSHLPMCEYGKWAWEYCCYGTHTKWFCTVIKWTKSPWDCKSHQMSMQKKCNQLIKIRCELWGELWCKWQWQMVNGEMEHFQSWPITHLSLLMQTCHLWCEQWFRIVLAQWWKLGTIVILSQFLFNSIYDLSKIDFSLFKLWLLCTSHIFNSRSV